jgi:hypothetical protein
MRRLTYANVVATLALFLALSTGGAYAAGKLIKGKRIARNAITSPKVRDGSLKAADLNAALVRKLGTPGPAGAAGTPGAAGAAGRDGAAIVAYKDFGAQSFPNIKWTVAAALDWTQPANTLEQVAGVATWPAAAECTGADHLLYQLILDGNEINYDYGNHGVDDAEDVTTAVIPNPVPEKGNAAYPDPVPFGAEIPLLPTGAEQKHHLELRVFAACGAQVKLDDLVTYVTQYAVG